MAFDVYDATVRQVHAYERHLFAPHNPAQFRNAAQHARTLGAANGITFETVSSSEHRFGEAVFVYPPSSIDNPVDDPWFDCHCADNWVDAAGRVDAYAAILRDNY